MSLVSRRKIYDRTRILREADQARSAHKWRRAIALYRRVLAAEPRNAELHLKLAPLLARTGNHFDAWQSFDLAGRACLDAGHPDRALAVYREAVKRMPKRYQAWRTLADVELLQRQPARAREVLLEGRNQMRGRGRRPEAIALLRAAYDLEPQEVITALDLARELSRARQQAEARYLLGKLADVAEGRAQRRVRGLLWRLDPSLRNSFAWIGAAWRARGDRSVRVSSRANRLAASRS